MKYLAYPLLLVSAVLTVVAALSFGWDHGQCNVLFLLWVIFYLAVLEKLIPYEKKWHPSRQEWLRDGLYFVLTIMGGASAVALLFYVAPLVKPWHLNLPLGLEVLMALILSSCGSYFFHRLSHVNPFLWRLHGIHHVEDKVNVGNNGVNHPLDVLGRRILAQLPLMFLALSSEALLITSIFNTMQGYFVHANVDVRLGIFNYVVVSPEQHRLHHSNDMSEAGHYRVDVPLWDLIFQSFYWCPGRKPRAIGVVNPKKFPPPDHIWASLAHPWRKYAKARTHRKKVGGTHA